MKKSIYFGVFFVFVILVGSFVSAGIFDNFYNKITGKAVTNATSLNITIGNSVPTITWVEVIPTQTPNENGLNSTTFNFTATDTDGFANIDTSTAEARFQKSGETTRTNTSCVSYQSGGDQVNFTCTVDLWYYDAAAADWTINVTVKDNNDAPAENSSTTFTYSSLIAMVMSPTALAWTEFGVAQPNQGANNDPLTINNTGNDVSLSINITAYDLQGETTTTQYIYAANLSVENVTQGCSGTSMLNATSLNVTSTILESGNNSLNYKNATSGQEQLFFCVTAVNSDLTAQSYSSAEYGTWILTIIT